MKGLPNAGKKSLPAWHGTVAPGATWSAELGPPGTWGDKAHHCTGGSASTANIHRAEKTATATGQPAESRSDKDDEATANTSQESHRNPLCLSIQATDSRASLEAIQGQAVSAEGGATRKQDVEGWDKGQGGRAQGVHTQVRRLLESHLCAQRAPLTGFSK